MAIFRPVGDTSLVSLAPLSLLPQASPSLAQRALFTLVESVRAKARISAWNVIRSAYREISCNAESEDTHAWLMRSLCLQSVIYDGHSVEPEQWLEQQSAIGHVRRKEGFEGRWVLSRVR